MAAKHRKILKSGAEAIEVRYYPHAGGRQKSKTFYDEADADAFMHELARALSKGEPAPEPHRRRRQITLGDWYLEHREKAGWSKNGYDTYRAVFRAHLASEAYGIADHPMAALDAERILKFRDDMEGAGIGRAAQEKTLTLLSSLFSAATQRRSYTGVSQNPMVRGGVSKHSVPRTRPALVFAPMSFEAVHYELAHDRTRSAQARARDALWFSFGSLAGLRPEEIWAITPGLVRTRTISVVQAVAKGTLKRTKEEEFHYPPLHPVLAEELSAYLERWPLDDYDALIFDDPARPGQPIADHNWRNWRERVWTPARDRAVSHVPARARTDLLRARPYDLGRHSYASLRIRAGMSANLTGLVAELGHTTVSQLSATYAHEIAEYRGAEAVDWVDEVRKARAQHENRALQAVA